ncbi:MAG: hypothetical protein NTW93_08835 [Phycisphaerae bacterium]|nr:hypothetical protein [Phycisphaerae bacterium]
MTDGEKLRRFGFDKVALLILLLIGLLAAKLIVSWRAGFKLSKPIVLQGTGLSVSVPKSGGFKQLSEGFEYDNSEFRLSCILQISSDTAVSVSWRYFLVPFKKTVAERFEAQASDIGGAIEKTGSEQFGQFPFDYARIASEKTSILLFSGITQLPDGRTLTLEVSQKGRDIDLAEKIFRSIAASVTFTPDSPLATGRKLLDNFRHSDLAAITAKKTEQNYYYIKNYTGQPLGFITDAISRKTDGRDANSLVTASLYFIRPGISSFAEQSLLRCDPNLQSFKWMSRQSDLLINRDLTTSIELDRQGKVTVQRRNIVQDFAFTSTMLPEILLDTLLESFLQSDFNSVMVDIILPDGRLAPTLVAKTEPQKAVEPNAAWAVRTEIFGTNTNQQTIYFDSTGKILLSEVHGRLSYKLEKTQRDRIIADFPQWLEKIQQIEQYIIPEKSKE